MGGWQLACNRHVQLVGPGVGCTVPTWCMLPRPQAGAIDHSERFASPARLLLSCCR